MACAQTSFRLIGSGAHEAQLAPCTAERAWVPLLAQVFLGTLREAEVERINNRISQAIMETCLAMTIFRWGTPWSGGPVPGFNSETLRVDARPSHTQVAGCSASAGFLDAVRCYPYSSTAPTAPLGR